MTRIRKNWSSSRGAEDPETVRSHVVVARESQDGKQASPILLQMQMGGLDLVNEDAIHMLAAVSLEHDNGALGNGVKRESSSAKVEAVSANSLEYEDGTHNVKHEITFPKTWDRDRDRDRPCTQGDGPMTQRKKGHWFQNLSPLDLWPSDRGPVAVTNASTKKEVDEEQSKSSSVADNEAKQDPAAAEPVQGLISELMQVHNPGRDPANKKAPRVLQDLQLRFPAGRKKRQKLWESELGPSAIGREDCKAGQQQRAQKPANSDGDGIGIDDATRRKVKTLRHAQDQAACNRNKVRPESEKVLDDQYRDDRAGAAAGDGDEDGDEKDKDDKNDCNDGGHENGLNADQVNDENGKRFFSKSGKALSTNAGEKNRLKARTEVAGNDIDDSTPLVVKLEKVGNDVDDRKRQRVNSQDGGSDTGERKKLRIKPSKTQGGSQGGTAEDIFPKGWKYKGLAQIAERDEATHGQIKKLCGRTDGHNWRCPLRVVEGLSLCQHHLNKAREKKLGRSSYQKKQSEKKPNNDAPPLPPTPPADSLTVKGSVPSDQHAPTKFRRRHKTAKLSVL